MKTLKDLRSKSETKKINGYPVTFTNAPGGKVKVTIDGDELDTYPTQAEAEKMAKEFMKQYKGKMK
jgi:hypothetical protein